MPILRYLPLLSIQLAVFNFVALSYGPEAGAVFSHVLLKANLFSGATFLLTTEQLLVMVGIGFLYFEILKSAQMTIASTVEHVLSVGIFIIYLVEFLMMPHVGRPTFLMLTLMSLLDVVAGFTVSIIAARRDIGVE